MENSKVFTAFFISVFSGKICFHIREEEVLERERERDLLSLEDNLVREYLNKQHAQVPEAWWDAPISAEGGGWCHGGATLD